MVGDSLDGLESQIDGLINDQGEPVADLHSRAWEIVSHLERAVRWPGLKSAELATQLHAVAVAHGLEVIAMRTQLLIADYRIRGGQGAVGGLAAREVQRWAAESGDAFVQARAHRVLATFYRRLGDQSLCLERAVDAARLLPDDAACEIRTDHHLLLADALARTGALDSARAEYELALELARASNKFSLPLIVLNNTVYSLYRARQVDEAMALAGQLHAEYKARPDIVVPAWAETVARVQIEKSAYDQAAATLEPVFAAADLVPPALMAGLAECYLCYSEIKRREEAWEGASLAVKKAEEVVRQHSIEYLRVDVCHEKATVLAAQGRMAEAYEAQRQAFLAAQSVKASERETKSKTLWAMHEMGQARAATQRFRLLSIVDPLTGLGNRRYVREALGARLGAARDNGQPLAVAMVDVDRFKSINDRFTHRVGDLVLQDLAGILARATQMPCEANESRNDGESPWMISVDGALSDSALSFAARMGGEEFVLILPDFGAQRAQSFCEDVLTQIREHPWHPDIPVEQVTASVGVAVLGATDTQTTLLDRADENLYQAKRTGRDRVCGPVGPIDLQEIAPVCS